MPNALSPATMVGVVTTTLSKVILMEEKRFCALPDGGVSFNEVTPSEKLSITVVPPLLVAIVTVPAVALILSERYFPSWTNSTLVIPATNSPPVIVIMFC